MLHNFAHSRDRRSGTARSKCHLECLKTRVLAGRIDVKHSALTFLQCGQANSAGRGSGFVRDLVLPKVGSKRIDDEAALERESCGPRGIQEPPDCLELDS